MEYKIKKEENDWLVLLENALKEGVQIQLNHRFKYKDKKLGTFLVGAKQRNKVALIKKIESLGFNFKKHSRDPQDYVENFILLLTNDKTRNKQYWINRFNRYILPKKRKIKKETIETLDHIWKERFGDKRKWTKPETDSDKIKKWKKFRYNEKVNPNEKWFDVKNNMGKLYSWVYTRKRDAIKMETISIHFTDQEKQELISEGFSLKMNS